MPRNMLQKKMTSQVQRLTENYLNRKIKEKTFFVRERTQDQVNTTITQLVLLRISTQECKTQFSSARCPTVRTLKSETLICLDPATTLRSKWNMVTLARSGSKTLHPQMLQQSDSRRIQILLWVQLWEETSGRMNLLLLSHRPHSIRTLDLVLISRAKSKKTSKLDFFKRKPQSCLLELLMSVLATR